MGTGYTLRCRKCGYFMRTNLGVGFMFPVVHQQIMKAARAGEFGEEIHRFLKEHPEGVLSTENVLLQCTGCGSLEHGPDLSMYLRRPGVQREKHGRWSVAFPHTGVDYTSPIELKEEKAYEFVAWGHVCRKCGEQMKPITQDDLEAQVKFDHSGKGQTEIACPECKEPLWIEDILMWD